MKACFRFIFLYSILILIPLLFSTCRASIPDRLFYRPATAKTYIYSNSPEKLRITAYPRPKGKIVGTVIFIHGGGWQVGGSDLPVYADWHYPLQDASLLSYSIEHRTAPKYRGDLILQDTIKAIKYIQKLNVRLGITSKKIAIIGYSSGGHLAILSASTITKNNADIDLKSVVAYYAPLDITSLVYYKDNRLLKLYNDYLPDILNFSNNNQTNKSIAQVKRSLKFHSPIGRIHKYMPNILLIHGKKDKLIPYTQSVNFAMQAERLVPGRVILYLVERADHNFVRSRKKWARKIDNKALVFVLKSFQ